MSLKRLIQSSVHKTMTFRFSFVWVILLWYAVRVTADALSFNQH